MLNKDDGADYLGIGQLVDESIVITYDDLQAIRDRLLEVREKYMRPYREKDAKQIERLCRKLEAIINLKRPLTLRLVE